MEYLAQWLKSIVVYFLLITVVMQILPNESWHKYLKVFIGMLLMILILQPVTKFFNLDENLANSFEKAVNALSEDDLKNNLLTGVESVCSGITRDYSEQMREKAEELVKKEGYELYDFSVTEDGVNLIIGTKEKGGIWIEEIVIEAGLVQTGKEEEKAETETVQNVSAQERAKMDSIKISFADFYNLDYGHINITIQR